MDRKTTYQWPTDAYIRSGAQGTKSYFEIYAKVPLTIITGFGKTIKEAEEQCWSQWQNVLRCRKHDYEPRHFVNGVRVCRHCGLCVNTVRKEEEI